MTRRPIVLLILTDQLRYPPPHESEELREYRRKRRPGEERLRENGVSFKYQYPMAAACAPSRASLLTGQYPSLHGVTQTDGGTRAARARRTQHRTVKDPFTADETIALLERFDGHETDEPWLTVCSFLNPHDDSLFGVIALAQGLRYHPSEVPHVARSPTHEEDLSTKPSGQQSYVDTWGKIVAPQPWIETHLKFYYQVRAAVDEQLTRVLDGCGPARRTRTRS